MKWKQADAESHDLIKDAVHRGFIAFKGSKVTYHLNQKKTYNWNDPEEWVRAFAISFLVFKKGYPPSRMKTEVKVPRRTPNDWADIVSTRMTYVKAHISLSNANLAVRSKGTKYKVLNNYLATQIRCVHN